MAMFPWKNLWKFVFEMKTVASLYQYSQIFCFRKIKLIYVMICFDLEQTLDDAITALNGQSVICFDLERISPDAI